MYIQKTGPAELLWGGNFTDAKAMKMYFDSLQTTK